MFGFINSPPTMKKHLKFLFFLMLSVCSIACQSREKPKMAQEPAKPDKSLAEYSPSVQTHLNQLKEEWSAVPNPLVARFTGAELVDYFHLTFEDAQGRTYDFGNGENRLGEMRLYGENFISNPEQVGKVFRIDWDWKKSSFYCCEGEMNTVEAPVPSIIAIEAVSANGQ